MKTKLLRRCAVGLLVLQSFLGMAQMAYTPYDDAPNVPAQDKPSYDESYPEWAKMLYDYPINFNTITSLYDNYMKGKDSESEGAIVRYFINWRSAIAPYVLDDGTIKLPDADELKAASSQSTQSTAMARSGAVDPSNWTFLGPKQTVMKNGGVAPNGEPFYPWQVNVVAFDASLSDPNVLYAGSDTGFVNKSTDKGETWTLCAPSYPFLGVAYISIDPTNPDIVYVTGNKVQKSIDGGQTWQQLTVPKLSKIQVSPTNPNIIAGVNTTKANKGIYISKDAGATWTKTYTGFTWDIEFKPGANSNTIYAISATSDNKFQILISTDEGDTFTPDPNFPSDKVQKSGGLLAVTPANPNVLYASVLSLNADGNGAPFVYKGTSDKSGAFTWVLTKEGQPIADVGLGGFSNGQGFYDFVLEASPSDENLVFWGTCSLFKSTDGAENFTKIGGYGGAFPIHPDMQSMKVMPNGDTWVTTDGGINFSTDYFTDVANWHVRIQNLVGSNLWGFDQSWNEDLIVGGRYHNGDTALSDTFEEKAIRLGGAESPTGWIVHAKPRQAAFKDINKNKTKPIQENIHEEAKGKVYPFTKLPNMKAYGQRRGNLLTHPNYNETLYVGAGTTFWRSTDMGATWDALHDFGNDVMFIDMSYKNPNFIYADVESSGLWKSEDGGLTWVNKSLGTVGTTAWNGRLHFAISPYDENTIYLCPQKVKVGWKGKILKSTDGGDTWENWTSNLPASQYTKTLVIQPTSSGEDLVYIFTIASGAKKSEVHYRRASDTDWSPFQNNYIAGADIKYAQAFFRDGKIRSAGGMGIYESPLAEPTFKPILNAWVGKKAYECAADTIVLTDHSMLNHAGASWKWTITPTPQYVSSTTEKTIKILPGTAADYSVTQEVTQDGVTYSKSYPNFFSAGSNCLPTCDAPGALDNNKWSLVYADSYVDPNDPDAMDDLGVSYEPDNAFDGETETYWQSNSEGFPHEIQMYIGGRYKISKLILSSNELAMGRVKDCEIYISDDTSDWGTPISATFKDQEIQDPLVFDTPITGKYLRIKVLNTFDESQQYVTINNISLVGCFDSQTLSVPKNKILKLDAYPIPTKGILNISLPGDIENLYYEIYSMQGQLVDKGNRKGDLDSQSFDLSKLSSGVYILRVKDADSGAIYRVKVVKE
ncbi:discoidin domain-containing protein [Tenacibaculum sp. UWU-22]|uniref:VPS10 domain-containing protein n=1 Tax=Tenacibaculum sp. UWU-22 TaxID=3234187 RepID=UPI0034DAD92F